MPNLGVWGTITTASVINIGVGLAVLGFPPLPEQQAAVAERPSAAPPISTRLHPLVLVAAAASGLMAMVTQVAWTRVLNLIVGSTTYAFSSVLLVYLVALGLGGLWASRRRQVPHVGPQLAIMHALFALGLLAAIGAVNRLPYWYLGLNSRWEPTTLAGIVAMQLTILCSVLLVPVVCAGTILPLVLSAAVPEAARDTGAAVGRVYAVNTMGAIVGALLGGFVLVPMFGTQASLIGICLLAAALAVAFAFWGEAPRWLRPVALAAFALVAVGSYLRPAWNYLELHAGVFEPGRIYGIVTDTLTEEGEETLYHREGPTASVLVSKRPSGNQSLLINARVNASDSEGDMATQVMLAQLPLLLAPRPEDVFIVGWGSGVTVGSAMVWPSTRVTAVELEPAVVEASRLYGHVNHKPYDNPRLRLYEDDARHILLASEETYDVIVSEPAHPWVSGVANLFTRDFYELVARRLRPDGVLAQWLQAYQISSDGFRSIMASFAAVFPEVYAFRSPNAFDVVLFGTHRPLALRLDELQRRWAVESTRTELARIGLERPEHLLATLLLGPDAVRTLASGARINTDNNMFVEFSGPRDMIAMRQGSIITRLLEQHATPIETVLADPETLVGSRENLQALIARLEEAERPTAHYQALLKKLE
jgi:spermidine synthase